MNTFEHDAQAVASVVTCIMVCYGLFATVLKGGGKFGARLVRAIDALEANTRSNAALTRRVDGLSQDMSVVKEKLGINSPTVVLPQDSTITVHHDTPYTNNPE